MKYLKTTAIGATVLSGLILFLGCCFNVLCKKDYTLKYNMKKGTEFSINYHRKNINEREVMGNKRVNLQEDSFRYEFTVLSNSEDGLEIGMEYKEKSDKTDDPQFSAGTDYSDLLGKKVKFLISSKGDVTGMENFEKLPEIPVLSRDMTFSANSYKNEIRQLFHALPEKQVSIGDTWVNEGKATESLGDGEVEVVVKYNYTLLEETDKNRINCLKIGAKYTIELKGSGLINAAKFEFNAKGNGNDVIYFSPEKGMIAAVEGQSMVEGYIVITEMNVTIPLKQDIETEINVTF